MSSGGALKLYLSAGISAAATVISLLLCARVSREKVEIRLDPCAKAGAQQKAANTKVDRDFFMWRRLTASARTTQQLLRRQDKTNSVAGRLDRRIKTDPPCYADPTWKVAPIAAAQRTSLTGLGACGFVGRAFGIIAVIVIIRHPLPDIAGHIVKPKLVRLLLSHRMTLEARVVVKPGVVAKFIFVARPGPFLILAAAAGRIL